LHLADLTPQGLVEVVAGLGQPAFRARQLARHYYVHLTCQPTDMTDIPLPVRQVLADELAPTLLTEVRQSTTDRGRTLKTLWSLADGARIESVVMRWPRRATVCVSTQVGCGLGCTLCATGALGLTRNLSTAEIVEQVRAAAHALDAGALAGGPGRLSHVVFMGMGEPLANYARTLAAVRAIVSPDGFDMAARQVTVSTVGLVPQIDRLADEGVPVTLALSLHAPDDELRTELVPVNTRWDVGQVLDAGLRYFEATGRRVSVEYALIGGVNDQPARADLLGTQLTRRGRGWAHVNLIPVNPVRGSAWTAPDASAQAQFVARLRSRGVPATVRDTRGSDIDGACGQLAGSEDE